VNKISKLSISLVLLGGCFGESIEIDNNAKNHEGLCELNVQHYEDEGTLVLNRREIDFLMRGDIIDAPISVASKSDNSKVWFLPTAMQQNSEIYLSHTIVQGDLKNVSEAKVTILGEQDMFVNSNQLENRNYGRHWITNVVQTPKGLIAILHSEYTNEGDFFGMPCVFIDKLNHCAPGYSQISLAWLSNEKFENDNYQFTFLGNIAGSYSELAHFNVHGTPWYLTTSKGGVSYLNLLYADAEINLIHDGEKYITSGDGVRIGRLRIEYDDLLDAVSNGTLGEWKKLTSEGWLSPEKLPALRVLPLVPEMQHIDKRIADGRVVVHSDAIFHEPTNSYFLSAYVLNRDDPSSLVFYNSCDGEKWNYVGNYHARTEGKNGWSYLTLLSSDDSDNGFSKSSFDLISGWEYGKEERRILRMKTEVGSGCDCPK